MTEQTCRWDRETQQYLRDARDEAKSAEGETHMSEDQFRRFIAHQHSLADAYVGVRLDDLCERNGLRRGVWRLPAAAHAARARNALHTHNGDHHDNAE